ncbi:hypothetical protein SPRG_20840 [Saprolegnia parasitica CBS 223.65]|uniref:Uncharacterized protein n=1 Tax=Saprolegnia parasitica (strain CBS 223.65) TaxID=695850 RepID=A0A067CDR6_SAPPC|nr:hypothetical protein SPRG_20840 [Saprolegnia parasitica CBS 223.65]KDO24967.1 hypothetical protein SPRG_20840 [Saprolegnia parasitica CBS 223.65]|eukprot:XP_012204323.1 hypothetical protein SPRG_20840 [Saprolegnia parasitica CBS 223.65]
MHLPLAALRTLVRAPGAVEDSYWPQVCIEDIDGQYTSTVLAALPAFGSISINHHGRRNDVLRSQKIKSMRVSSQLHRTSHGVLCRIPMHCNGLNRIQVDDSSGTRREPLQSPVRPSTYVTRIALTAAVDDALASECWLPSSQRGSPT